MARYAVLLGLGLFKRTNAAYRRYVINFASFVNRNEVDAIVLSGGHTDPKRPSESEAESIAGYLQPLLKRDVRMMLEGRSLTTAQNVEFSRRFISPRDDVVTVFCDNVRPPKVMWFILHFWFGLSRGEIEQYFVDYGRRYYSRHYTTEEIGNEIVKGLTYKNVTVRPYRMHERIEAAVSQEVGTLLEVNALYDKQLGRKLMKNIKVKFGLI